MNKQIINRLIWVLLIVVIAVSSILWGIRHQKRSSTPEAVVQQVKSIKNPLPNLEILDAVWAGSRIVAQVQYTGPDAQAPQAPFEWHQLAQSCAEQIHLELNQKHTIEVQLFHNFEFRAVSVAGL